MAIPPGSMADFHQVLIKSGYEDRVLLKAQQMDNPAWDLGDPLVIRGNPTHFDSYDVRNRYPDGGSEDLAPDWVNERTSRFETNIERETPPRRRLLVGRVWDDHIPFDPNFDTWEQIKNQLVDEGNRMSAMAAFARQRDYRFFQGIETTATEIDTTQGNTDTFGFGEVVSGAVDANLTVAYNFLGGQPTGTTGASVSKVIEMNRVLDGYNADPNRALLMHSAQYNQLFEEARATSTDFMMQATLPSGRIPSIMGHPLVVSNECTAVTNVGDATAGHYMYLLTVRRAVRTGEAGPLRVNLHQDPDRGDMIILSHYWVFEAVRAHEQEVARAACSDTATATS